MDGFIYCSEEEGEQFLRMQQGNTLQCLDGIQSIEPAKKMDDQNDLGYFMRTNIKHLAPPRSAVSIPCASPAGTGL